MTAGTEEAIQGQIERDTEVVAGGDGHVFRVKSTDLVVSMVYRDHPMPSRRPNSLHGPRNWTGDWVAIRL